LAAKALSIIRRTSAMVLFKPSIGVTEDSICFNRFSSFSTVDFSPSFVGPFCSRSSRPNTPPNSFKTR
uniref:Secreted protein n=1 Tax=Hymenolepis diminuta TaxID=6216 RepID=A0A0R3SEQ2_HYMDI